MNDTVAVHEWTLQDQARRYHLQRKVPPLTHNHTAMTDACGCTFLMIPCDGADCYHCIYRENTD